MKLDKTARPGRKGPELREAPPPVELQPSVARSIFGHVAELHRPRLVLFVGTPASSQAAVAALWFGALAAESKATIVLACADGAPPLSPEMVVALAESGLDARRLIARTLTPELLAAADLVVTLSSGRQARPKLPQTTRRREHWTVPADRSRSRRKPRAGTEAGKPARRSRAALSQAALAAARGLRDTLRARVAMLVFSEGWGRPEISREDARVTRAKPAAQEGRGSPAEPVGSRAPFLPSIVPEVTPAWVPAPSPVPPSFR
jgi:protein-tyrosine-phosphatase